jgi:hypothetical protein
MSKEEKDNVFGFDVKEAIEVARDTSKIIGEKILKLSEPKAWMFALDKAIQPMLIIFGRTMEMDGEDPVPSLLDLIKKEYMAAKDIPSVKDVFEKQGSN